jgi:eukaryotic-like serine/threonine-protein kinase
MPEARVFANRYELGEEIGRGGMADVYLAHDRLLDRQVAVKVLSPEFASDRTNFERFRREARAAAGLNHPNIVAVYDWGEEDDTSYIVMEYVPGQTLRDLIQAYGHLSPTEAARIAAEIADALSFAHEHGVVHRDVKPGNVLITPHAQVKVTDFGIARAETGDPLTKTGSVLGTATYFSPEQAQGLTLDGRSDVYALGVVLYEMVTGTAPFTAASPVSVAYKHVREEPAAPSTIVRDLPGAMDRIVLTAMAKDVNARYQSAQDLRADLLRFERGRPLVGGPATAVATEIPTTVVAAPVAAVAARRAAPAPVPVDPAQPSRRRTSWGAIAAVGVALVLLLALIVVLLVQSDFGGSDNAAPTLDVPAVIGVPYGQAEAALTSLGFTVQRTDQDAPYQAPNVVLGQQPEQGRKIPKGGLITLTVSSTTITIPDVVGQTKEAAASALAKVNLAPKYVEGDSDQPPGTVLGTYPGVGAQVDKPPSGPGTVAVLIARPPAVPVPDVAGQDPYPALLTLGGAGFQVTVVPTPSDTVPSGKVIGTDPAAGTPLPRGSAVNLLVSSGTAAVDVPNVVGQPKAAAEAVLLGAGFGVRESFVNAGPSKTGKVVGQSPSGGPAPKGSTVAVTIGL